MKHVTRVVAKQQIVVIQRVVHSNYRYKRHRIFILEAKSKQLSEKESYYARIFSYVMFRFPENNGL